VGKANGSGPSAGPMTGSACPPSSYPRGHGAKGAPLPTLLIGYLGPDVAALRSLLERLAGAIRIEAEEHPSEGAVWAVAQEYVARGSPDSLRN
jgi:hypothetical protein